MSGEKDTKEIIFHSYEIINIKDFKDRGYSEIHFWGLTPDSTSVLIRIEKFPISCYVELPTRIDGEFIEWSEEDPDFIRIINYLKKKLGDNVFTYYEYKEKFRLHYHSSTPRPMILFHFLTEAAMYDLFHIIRYPFTLNGNEIKLTMFENSVDIVRKLHTSRNLKYCQWMKINCYELDENDENRITNTGADPDFLRSINVEIPKKNREFFGLWETMTMVNKEEAMTYVSYPRMLSFDIENYSDNHRSMPKEMNHKHVTYLISCIYQRDSKPETKKRCAIIYGDCDDIIENNQEYAYVIRTKSEHELINAFTILIKNFDPDILSGYNIFAYDYPYLNVRINIKMKKFQQCGRIIGDDVTIFQDTWKSSAYGTQNINILQFSGRISIDLLPIVRRDYKLDKYDLNTVSKYFLDRGKHDVDHKEIFVAYETYTKSNNLNERNKNARNKIREKMLKGYGEIVDLFKEDDRLDLELRKSKEKMTRITKYCIQDAELVVDLFTKLKTWVALVQFSGVVGVTITDLFTRGQQVRCYSQIYDEAAKSGFVVDKRFAQHIPFKGAFVASPMVGLHPIIICLDFNSLYPTIIIAYNLCYSTFVKKEDWDKVPIEWCHVIEFEQEEEVNGKVKDLIAEDDGDDEDEEDDDEEEGNKRKKKEVKTVKKRHEYRFLKAEYKKGIVPRLLERLIDERNRIKKEIKVLEKVKEEYMNDPKGFIEKIEHKLNTLTGKERDVELANISLYLPILHSTDFLKDLLKLLDIKDKEQLARKVSANSMYGFFGAQAAGMMPLIEAALCVTAIGRESIAKVNKMLKEKYNADIAYGDTDSTMVRIPELKNPKDCKKWGLKLMDDINGVGEKRIINEITSEITVIPARKGLFLPPMRIEYEKAGKFFFIAKKKYRYFPYNDNGEFKRHKNGEIDVQNKGLLTARRDNHAMIRRIFDTVANNILFEVPFSDNFSYVVKEMCKLLNGEVDVHELSIIRGIGSNYKNENYFIAVFASELRKMGQPVQPGDRISYVVVKTKEESEGEEIVLGKKMRMIEMWEQSQNEAKNPTATEEELKYMYPAEDIDYFYYINNTMMNPLDQLLSTGYGSYLSKYDRIGYKPIYNRCHFVSMQLPIKVICSFIKDQIDFYNKYRRFVDDDVRFKDIAKKLMTMPDWFEKEVEKYVPIAQPITESIQESMEEKKKPIIKKILREGVPILPKKDTKEDNIVIPNLSKKSRLKIV
jgi:DNA polymerase elongation subunit (family B)